MTFFVKKRHFLTFEGRFDFLRLCLGSGGVKPADLFNTELILHVKLAMSIFIKKYQLVGEQ